MAAPDAYYQTFEAADPRVSVFPFKPFGRGYLVDKARAESYSRWSIVWFVVVVVGLRLVRQYDLPVSAFYAAAALTYLLKARLILKDGERTEQVHPREWALYYGDRIGPTLSGLCVLISACASAASLWLSINHIDLTTLLSGIFTSMIFGFGLLFSVWMLCARR